MSKGSKKNSKQPPRTVDPAKVADMAGIARGKNDFSHFNPPPPTPLGTEMYVNHIEDWLVPNSKKVSFDDLFIEVFCSLDKSFVGFTDLGNLYYWENWTMQNRPDMYSNQDLLLHFVRHCLVDYRMEEYFFPDQSGVMESIDENDTEAIEAAALDDTFEM